jgi:hypothetical protein
VRMYSPPSPKFSTAETTLLLVLRQATTVPRGEERRGYRRRSMLWSTIRAHRFMPMLNGIQHPKATRFRPVFERLPVFWSSGQPRFVSSSIVRTLPSCHETPSARKQQQDKPIAHETDLKTDDDVPQLPHRRCDLHHGQPHRPALLLVLQRR